MRVAVPRSRPVLSVVGLAAGMLVAVPSADAAGPVPTETVVRCAGNGLSGMRSCEVGVWADVPQDAPTPTGTVSWVSSGPDSQTVAASCVLLPRHPTWSPSFKHLAWCDGSYTSPGDVAPRTETIVATYAGDERYASSSASTTYVVPDPNAAGPVGAAPSPAGEAAAPAPTAGTPGGTASATRSTPAVVRALAATSSGLTLDASARAASTIRIDRRLRRTRADGRTTVTWRTIRRLRRTLADGRNRVPVRLRPGVHRITVAGGAVRPLRATLVVRR